MLQTDYTIAGSVSGIYYIPSVLSVEMSRKVSTIDVTLHICITWCAHTLEVYRFVFCLVLCSHIYLIFVFPPRRLPTGALIVGMRSMAGDNSRDRRRRERSELYDLKLAEWTDRLNVTEELIGDLNVGSQAEEVNTDMQRIQELLSLPKNEDVTHESPSQ